MSVSEAAALIGFGVVAAAIFFATLRNLSNGVAALAASVPIQSAFALHLGGREVTWTKLVVAVVLAAWGVRICSGVSRPRFDAIGIAFGAYLLALVVSVTDARDIGAWEGEVYRWGIAWVVYLLAVDAFSAAPKLRRVIVAGCAGLIGVGAYGVWQVASGAGPATFAVDGVTRAYGTFGEPNPFAAYLELTVLPLIAIVCGLMLTWPRLRGHRRAGQAMIVLVSATAIFGSAVLLLTQSRGGFLGFAAGIAVVVWLTGGRVRWAASALGAVAVVIVLLSPFGATVRDRFGANALSTGPTQVTVDNWATQERAAHWRAAIAMAERSPITGVGAGNYNTRFRESTTVWRFRIPRGHAHNAYLQALAQAGMIGLVTYLALILIVVREIVRALASSVANGDGETTLQRRAIVIGVAGATVALMIHNLVDYLHVLSLGITLSIIWASLRLTHLNADQFAEVVG